LKQLFSLDNFLQIYHYENRKGNFSDKVISDDLYKVSLKILDINIQIKQEKKNRNSGRVKELYDYKKIILNTKDKILQNDLLNIVNKIKQNDFVFDFNKFVLYNKTVYTLQQTSEVFFILKKLQYNIKHSFKVKQSNRYEITNQVKNLLNNNFPKYIIRTDIKNFYESISHKILKQKIYQNNILDNFSKRLILKILKDFKNYSELNKGIPRGIGISAYLSEVYMENIDNNIKSLPDVTYYARYVDDIIVIFTPNKQNEKNDYLQQIQKIVQQESLELNSEKTQEFDLTSPSKNQNDSKTKKYTLEFLGYKYFFNNIKKENQNRLIIGLSDRKKKKYIKKIRLAFKDYTKNSKYNEKKARKLLVWRIRFLTENTRLLNAKKDILIGINFSNPLLNNNEDLKFLDRYLRRQIRYISPYFKLLIQNDGYIDLDKLKNRLEKFSFEKGFKEKRFYKFTRKQLEETIKIWKDI
jgi:hypothetical protein